MTVPNTFFIKTLSEGANYIGSFSGIEGNVYSVISELFCSELDSFSVRIGLFIEGESISNEINNLSESLSFTGEQYYTEAYFNKINKKLESDQEFFVVAFVEGDCSDSGFVFDSFNLIRNKEVGYNSKCVFLVDK